MLYLTAYERTGTLFGRCLCGTCGSHLWLRDTVEPGAPCEMLPGAFPEAADLPLTSEIYIDRRPAYLPIDGDHIKTSRADYEADNRAIEGDDP